MGTCDNTMWNLLSWMLAVALMTSPLFSAAQALTDDCDHAGSTSVMARVNRSSDILQAVNHTKQDSCCHDDDCEDKSCSGHCQLFNSVLYLPINAPVRSMESFGQLYMPLQVQRLTGLKPHPLFHPPRTNI